jgi:methylated-DNA-[protein]-cysteine S-methyltransferase
MQKRVAYWRLIDFASLSMSISECVWQALLNVPFGHTISYQQLAKNIANEKAVRAAANANAANALSIIIPCHRVIGIHGNLMGYAGGIKTKQGLLKLEQTI